MKRAISLFISLCLIGFVWGSVFAQEAVDGPTVEGQDKGNGDDSPPVDIDAAPGPPVGSTDAGPNKGGNGGNDDSPGPTTNVSANANQDIGPSYCSESKGFALKDGQQCTGTTYAVSIDGYCCSVQPTNPGSVELEAPSSNTESKEENTLSAPNPAANQGNPASGSPPVKDTPLPNFAQFNKQQNAAPVPNPLPVEVPVNPITGFVATAGAPLIGLGVLAVLTGMGFGWNRFKKAGKK